jgi:hypothetical protein
MLYFGADVMALTDFLTDSMTVKSKANTQANNAGFGRTDVVEQSSIPCMVMDSSGGQRFIGGGRGIINDHPIVTEYSGVGNGDVVVITTETGASATCRVDQVNQRRQRGGIDTFFYLTVQEIES